MIDFHTHCFPDKIAARAIAALKNTSADMHAHTDGTLSGLSALQKACGVDRFVVQHIATNPKQMQAVNNFAASIQSDTVFSFGSVHPDAPDALEELERIRALQLHGVKLHPEFQGFFVDDERLFPLYKKISDLALPVLFHAGGDISYMPPYHCTPQRLLKILPLFSVPVIAAHWGAYLYWEEVLAQLCGTDIYIDTSMGHSILPLPLAEAIAQKHTPDKLLFASDAPWQSPGQAQKLVEALGFSESEKEKIYETNAKKILKLS